MTNDKRPLPIRARVDDFTGYGQFSSELVAELVNLGIDVRLFPVVNKFRHGPTPEHITKTASLTRNHSHPTELLLYTLVVGAASVTTGKRTTYFSMWESTRIPPDAFQQLNRASLVITPNHWCASVFSASGVYSPITICPLGIRVEDFMPMHWPDNLNPEIPFTIGTAGRFEGGGVRKGLDTVVRAFLRAFPREAGVRLRVKATGDCPVPNEYKDPRIEVIKWHLNQVQLREWYGSLHVFASGSGCEGWGRHQQEAMSVGRPVIGVNFGGVTEFWNPTNGYAVDYELVPGDGPYLGHGYYAGPDIKSMSEQMRRAFEDRRELQAKSSLAIRDSHIHTTRKSAERLIRILQTHDFL